MITVSISINGRPIYARSAVNIGPSKSKLGTHDYKVDTGEIVRHKRENGAVCLVRLLLATIHEVKYRN